MRLFRPVLITAAACIAVFTLSRIGIVVWQFDRLTAIEGSHLPFVFMQGLRFDLVTLGILLGIPAILTPVFAINQRLAKHWHAAVNVYCLFVLGVIVYMELATPSFIGEFDVKPDRRFFEYLVYPREVFGMLWSAYKVQIVAAFIATATAVLLLRRWLKSTAAEIRPLTPWKALLLFPLVCFLVLASIRSTNDHRPVNPSTVVFSSDPLANELPLNSTYTALYALYELRHEDSKFAYREVPARDYIRAVRADMRLPGNPFTGGPESTLHWQTATHKSSNPLNLVIILEESLGADYVGALGGMQLTPELDKLASDGIWFENLYATGTRSVRGIEAVIAGFPPTTSRSVVKLPKAQTGFFTIADLLDSRDYSTSFIYGGEPQFDNMGRFFANNGFQHIVGRESFTGEVFDGDWGASDEDLFRFADEYFRQQPADKPFFSLLFTTSNHSPFDYPAGRIEPVNAPAATLENAVKYADWALGDFIRKARQSPYWDNTIFLVIADHSDRVYGDEAVPIRLFHIPALILGGPVQPEHITRVASQIDMMPTLLSLLGISAEHPAIGIDQTRTDLDGFPGRAVMQYGNTQAYMVGDEVAILQKGLPVKTYHYEQGTLVPIPDDSELLKQAIGYANWPWHTYNDKSYCLPAQCDHPQPRHLATDTAALTMPAT